MTDHEETPDDGPDLTRREFNAGLAGLGASSTTALSLGRSFPAALTPATIELLQAEQSRWKRPDIDLEQKTYGGQPSWAVHFEDGNAEALADWVGAEDDATLVRNNGDWGVATIALPAERVHDTSLTSLDDSGLAALSYVTTISPDLLVQVEPVSALEGADAWDSSPNYRLPTEILSAAPSSINDTGVAFDEVKTRTLQTAREVVADDTVSAEGGTQPLAVIDTGVNHGELRLFTRTDADGNTVTRIMDASKDFVDNDETTVAEGGLDVVADPNGHGTWVAAAAAANPTDTTYHGVATSADVLALRVLDAEGSGSTATIAAAVRYAADQGAAAACMSLGSPIYNEDLEEALDYAVENGTIPVAAAGNSRSTERFLSYPAASPNAIAVGSTTAQAPPDTRTSYFGNVGPSPGTDDFSSGETAEVELDVSAPGHELEATVATDRNSLTTRVLSGTSMAAPFVAGAATVLAGLESSLAGDLEAMRKRLRTTAEPVEQLAAAELGDGLLDVQAAVDNTTPDEEQADVMNADAAARDGAYRAESDARGGWINSF